MSRRAEKHLDALGIEPNTFRMLSGCDNQLHHVPLGRTADQLIRLKQRSAPSVVSSPAKEHRRWQPRHTGPVETRIEGCRLSHGDSGARWCSELIMNGACKPGREGETDARNLHG